MPRASPSASSAARAARSTSATSRSSSAAASASPCSRTTATSPTACSRTPTPPCTMPRSGAGTTSSSIGSGWARAASSGSPWSASCAARSRATSSALHFQPHGRSARAARVVGFEALLRWQHPRLGVGAAGPLHPSRRGDRADPADRRVGDREACLQAQSWAAAGLGSLRSRSTSRRSQLAAGELRRAPGRRARGQRRSRRSCWSWRSPRPWSWPIRRLPRQLDGAPRARGVLAIDDFGTGHSSR